MTGKEYDVGYGKPPRSTQFKPGTSGNLTGRPKTIKTFQSELLDELAQQIRFREGKAEVEITNARAIARTLVQKAVGGNLRAMTTLFNYCGKIMSDGGTSNEEDLTAEDADILKEYAEHQLRRVSDAKDVESPPDGGLR